ncbi:phosphotransferase [Actinopolymorpha rutila]|uniref:Aminoglycoside phosphotransferase (APT) family kinase protein n=1 Tax=Actinopolymorpha rutila TaxID=446787 RepID=A0A852ZG37_9ACTN|nr:aminoglycoside phosphotransferase (APT) family kinase protein [Actinopolymorpha rutila]
MTQVPDRTRVRPIHSGAGPADRLSSESARFAEALQPRVMGPRLAAALGGSGGRSARACHVLDAKYEPGHRALVLYQYGEHLVRGDLLGEDLLGGDGAANGGGPLVAPGVRLSVFPHDPDLPWLRQVLDPAILARRMRDTLGDRAGTRVSRCRVRLLRYRPGKRATLWLEFAPGDPSYVVKVYHDPDKASAVVRESRALAAAPSPAGVLELAPVVAHLPDLATVVQAAVSGVPLERQWAGRRVRSAAAAVAAVRQAAQALAELHAYPVISTRERPVERELRRFGLRAGRIATVDESLGTTLAGLAERLDQMRAAVCRTDADDNSLVHGDCKPSQFLLDGHRVAMLDLDHCGVAHPAGDLGTFLASLTQQAVRCGLAGGEPADADLLAVLGEEFLTAYFRARGGWDDPTACLQARWYEAVALERKALRAFARAPRSPLPGALAAHAHRCLDKLERARP